MTSEEKFDKLRILKSSNLEKVLIVSANAFVGIAGEPKWDKNLDEFIHDFSDGLHMINRTLADCFKNILNTRKGNLKRERDAIVELVPIFLEIIYAFFFSCDTTKKIGQVSELDSESGSKLLKGRECVSILRDLHSKLDTNLANTLSPLEKFHLKILHQIVEVIYKSSGGLEEFAFMEISGLLHGIIVSRHEHQQRMEYMQKIKKYQDQIIQVLEVTSSMRGM